MRICAAAKGLLGCGEVIVRVSLGSREWERKVVSMGPIVVEESREPSFVFSFCSVSTLWLSVGGVSGDTGESGDTIGAMICLSLWR